MKKVVILGAGLATRLYPITHHIPKVLVNYGQHTILKHLYDQYTKLGADQIHLVIHSKFVSTVAAYCKQEGLNVHIDTVDEAYGSAYAINQIARWLNNHNVVFNWCDVIPEFRNFSWDKNVIYTHGTKCRFNFDGENLKEVGPTGGNVVGIYQCKKFYQNEFSDKDEASEFFKGRDFVERLTGSMFEVGQLKSLVDLGDLQKLIDAHSNAVIPREFNKVEITENMVYKTALNDKGVELQKREIAWYGKVNSTHVPDIYNYRGEGEGNMISMSRIKGRPLYQAFERSDIDSVLEMLNLGGEGDLTHLGQNFDADMQYEVVDKVLARCASIQPLIDSFGQIKFVNGVRIGRLKPMLIRALNHLRFGINQNYSIIHGDPNFSNIMVDEEKGELKMIDPRGYFGETELYGPKDYDIAKVLYALTGYDKFNSDPTWGWMDISKFSATITIEPLTEVRDLPQFNAYHHLWVAVIWIALGGYFKNNPLKAVAAYYHGMKLLTLALDKLGRRLENGDVARECELVEAKLVTKCVDKWLLIDLETGERYKPAERNLRHQWTKL